MSSLTDFNDKDLRLSLMAQAWVGLPAQDTLQGSNSHRISAPYVTNVLHPTLSEEPDSDTSHVRFCESNIPAGYTFYTQINFSTYSPHPIYGAILKCQHQRHEVAIINKTTALRKYSTKNMHPFT